MSRSGRAVEIVSVLLWLEVFLDELPPEPFYWPWRVNPRPGQVFAESNRRRPWRTKRRPNNMIIIILWLIFGHSRPQFPFKGNIYRDPVKETRRPAIRRASGQNFVYKALICLEYRMRCLFPIFAALKVHCFLVQRDTPCWLYIIMVAGVRDV